MKLSRLLTGAALCVMLAGGAFEAEAQMYGGVGPAIAGSATKSQLPDNATKFLEKHYKNVAIREIEREFASGTFEVELANGTDIEFSSEGKVIEIDAPDRGPALSKDVVKEILPSKAYKRLEQAGQVKNVDEIDLDNGSIYVIKTRAVKKMKYGYDVNEDTWVMY
ncbi:MAG: PepSY-like domain-containing protein [Bacteroidales bacterium]|nr:PepSY-like domain-containing protein [Bacteroidales bacterium]